MIFTARSVPGNGLYRPQPTIFESKDGKTVAVITNWGNATRSSLISEKIESVLTPQLFDPDKTQAVRKILSASGSIELKLGEALRSANDELYKRENEKIWKTVIEVTVIHLESGVLYWAQAGMPHLLMSTNISAGRGAEFLTVSPDASAIFSQPIPLPTSGLGLDRIPNINSGSVPVKKGIKLAFLSIPGKALPVLSQTEFQVDHLIESFSAIYPDQPSWIAVTEVS